MRRNASIGTRLWPPASTFASSPCSASEAHDLVDRLGRVVFERRRLHAPPTLAGELTPASGSRDRAGVVRSSDHGTDPRPGRRTPRSRRGSGATATRRCRPCRRRTCHRQMPQVVHEVRDRIHEPRRRRDARDRPRPDEECAGREHEQRQVERAEIADQVLVVAAVHRDPAPAEREVVVERTRRELRLQTEQESRSPRATTT